MSASVFGYSLNSSLSQLKKKKPIVELSIDAWNFKSNILFEEYHIYDVSINTIGQEHFVSALIIFRFISPEW